jgi:peptide-methionine (R)-S-oxide reductase
MRHSPLLLLVLIGFTGCGATGYSAPPASAGSTSDTNVTTPAKAPVVRGKKPVVPEKTKKIAPSEKKMPDKITRTEEEWKKLLSPAQYQVLRKKGTERPFVNEFDEHFKPGVYACAACGQELFSSETKFNSGCGWPAFYAAQAGDRVQLTPDFSHGMRRIEVTCARCGSHLGHIFEDAPQTPTGQRYCINSISLKFIPAGGSKGPPAKGDEGSKPKAKDASPPAEAGKSETQ